MTGVYVGSEAVLQELVDSFVTEVGTSPFTSFVGSAGYLDAMLIEAGCEQLQRRRVPSTQSEPRRAASQGALCGKVEHRRVKAVGCCDLHAP